MGALLADAQIAVSTHTAFLRVPNLHCMSINICSHYAM